MKSIRRTTIALAAGGALCGLPLVAYLASADWDPDIYNLETVLLQDHQCGANDLPEPGIQGDVPRPDQTSGRAQLGYNCGLALVGHTRLDFDGRTPTGNANTAFAGHCAYVGNNLTVAGLPSVGPGSGVAVVDVADSAHPKHVATLRHPGSVAVGETIHALTTPSGRSILVAGQYGNTILSLPAELNPRPMDIYDVSDPDCSKWKHMATYFWPDNIHNLTISPDGRYVIRHAAAPDGRHLRRCGTPIRRRASSTSATCDDVMEGPMRGARTVRRRRRLPARRDSRDPAPAATRVTRPRPTSTGVRTARSSTSAAQLPVFEIFTILDVTEWLERDASEHAEGAAARHQPAQRTRPLGATRRRSAASAT